MLISIINGVRVNPRDIYLKMKYFYYKLPVDDLVELHIEVLTS